MWGRSGEEEEEEVVRGEKSRGSVPDSDTQRSLSADRMVRGRRSSSDVFGQTYAELSCSCRRHSCGQNTSAVLYGMFNVFIVGAERLTPACRPYSVAVSRFRHMPGGCQDRCIESLRALNRREQRDDVWPTGLTVREK